MYLNTDMTKPRRTEDYTYRSYGGRTMFKLSPEDGLRWQLECRKIARDRPDDPHPGRADYERFIQTCKPVL